MSIRKWTAGQEFIVFLWFLLTLPVSTLVGGYFYWFAITHGVSSEEMKLFWFMIGATLSLAVLMWGANRISNRFDKG